MERSIPERANALAPQVGGAPVFSSDNYDMYEIVSILRCCSLMVSSRYHAMVTSMPALVPSAGVTMDERIRNLLRERGHEHLLLTVDDPDLAKRSFRSSWSGWRRKRTQFAMASRIGGAQSENHGAHGRVPGARGAERIRNFQCAPACTDGKNICRRSMRIWKDF